MWVISVGQATDYINHRMLLVHVHRTLGTLFYQGGKALCERS